MEAKSHDEQAQATKESRVYEAPAIVFQGALEAHAVSCNQKGACTSPST